MSYKVPGSTVVGQVDSARRKDVGPSTLAAIGRRARIGERGDEQLLRQGLSSQAIILWPCASPPVENSNDDSYEDVDAYGVTSWVYHLATTYNDLEYSRN